MHKSESELEKDCLKWLANAGWEVADGEEITPDGKLPLRQSMAEAVLRPHAEEMMGLLNPHIPKNKLQEALKNLIKPQSPDLAITNYEFTEALLRGMPVKYNEGGKEKYETVRFIDFTDVSNNRFFAANQFTVTGEGVKSRTRRPDIVCFINGFPIAVIELKVLADDPKMAEAYNQLQTYKHDILALFYYNQIMATSDGINCHVGSLTSPIERFSPWRTGDKGKTVEWQLEVAIQRLFPPKDILDYMRYFVSFENNAGKITKKCAAYHQFYGVRDAVKKTVRAIRDDKKGGVFWHTQGSGKSFSMCCYAAMLHRHAKMKNPTIVVVTDRNDLDGQLFRSFCDAKSLLRQTPVQTANRQDLRERLEKTGSGGIYFATMQKFELTDDDRKAGMTQFPELNSRDNIVVIADEAHRTQYGLSPKLSKGQYKTGFARNLREALPNATFIGFTGTPIALDDRDTQAVFGDYVSIYDIEDAVQDKVTVPIYHEPRMVILKINDEKITELSQEVEETVEEYELEAREKMKAKWTRMEKLVGAKPRIKEVANDIVGHYEKRNKDIKGKAMIVAMSRKICVSLYDELVALKPDWGNSDISKGEIKIIMTGSASDDAELQPHITTGQEKRTIEGRFKDPDDPLNIVIVCDMWLTGFDVPACHTMYIDKPMKGHNLMQAIARVNRVFKDKSGGVVVDYIGIAGDLEHALKIYAKSKGKGKIVEDVEKLYDELVKKIDEARGLFAKIGKAEGFDYTGFEDSVKAQELLIGAANYLLSAELEDGKKRFLDITTAMRKAYAHCQTMDKVKQFEEEIAFFFAIRSVMVNHTSVSQRQTQAEKDSILQHVLNSAVIAKGIHNILGMPNNDISILSDDFLKKLQELPHKNLVAELLEKLIKDTIKSKSRTNTVQEKKYDDRLNQILNKYHNRSIEAAEVIERLVEIAKDYREDLKREEEWDLTHDEIAFYDALADNESAVKLMKDDILKKIAQEIAEKLRKSGTLDWAHKESVRAGLRIQVRRILRKYKYPPDATPKATETVIKQAEAIEAHKVETDAKS